ncbi:hypothetical protein JCM10213v2_008338 [Rhodosporidiobolus nylandii]
MAGIVPPKPGSRGPLATSCDTCRLRRVKCKRPEEGGPCGQCMKQAPTAPVAYTTADTLDRPATSSSSSYSGLPIPASVADLPEVLRAPAIPLALVRSTSSPQLEASGNSGFAASDALMRAELSGSLGAQLLRLYNEAGGGADGALYPLPVINSQLLLEQYEKAGRRLGKMDQQDELLCRTVFPLAARLLTSSSARPPSDLSRQLFLDAQTHADALAVWRKPTRTNAISLLLLHQAAGNGEISHPDTRPYMAGLVEQVSQLLSVDPQAIKGAQGSSTSNLGWCIGAFDAFTAVEAGRAPRLSEREYRKAFDLSRPALPSRATLSIALAVDPFSLTSCILGGLALVISIARDVAYNLEDFTTSGVVERGPESFFPDVWQKIDAVQAWAGTTLDFARGLKAEDAFCMMVIELFTSLAYGAAVFIELSILLHLEQQHEVSNLPPSPLLQQGRLRFPRIVCQYLRDIRASSVDYLSCFTACAWSVSRFAKLAQVFIATSAWSKELHGGPEDKLASLQFLEKALNRVDRSYHTNDISTALQALSVEKATLGILLDPPTRAFPLPPALAALAAAQGGFTAPTSMAQLSSWTYDRDERSRSPPSAGSSGDALDGQELSLPSPIAFPDYPPSFRDNPTLSASYSISAALPYSTPSVSDPFSAQPVLSASLESFFAAAPPSSCPSPSADLLDAFFAGSIPVFNSAGVAADDTGVQVVDGGFAQPGEGDAGGAGWMGAMEGAPWAEAPSAD